MVSISTLSRKCVSARRNEVFHRKFVPLAGKTASAVSLGIEKMEENRFTPNLKNSVHQHRKGPNRSIKFAINQKSVSTRQNEGFPEKYDLTGPKNYFHSTQCLKKKKKEKENGF